MKNVFVMMFVTSFAFALQAGEMRWEASDATEGGSDIIASVPQDALDSVASLINLDNVGNMMGSFYKATFAPIVNGILSFDPSASFSSDQLADYVEDDALAVKPLPVVSAAVAKELFTGETDIVPEPSTALLVLAGASAILLRRRRA